MSFESVMFDDGAMEEGCQILGGVNRRVVLSHLGWDSKHSDLSSVLEFRLQ